MARVLASNKGGQSEETGKGGNVSMNDRQQKDIALHLIDSLIEVVGRDHVVIDPDSVQRYSMDFSEMPMPAGTAVVRPGCTEEVVGIVKAIAAAGYAITVRGGGTSYTQGYVPKQQKTVVIDTSRMNRIIEINQKDLYVTVETGVTWKELRDALRGMPYEVAFRGGLSGIMATIGGGLGNNVTGLGRGCVTDDLLGLEVVLGDGRVIQTGGRAAKDGKPFIRGWGPDLTSLFVNDAGAFGIKTKATFRLVFRPGGTSYVAFGFHDNHKMLDALIEIEKTGMTSEAFGFSGFHNRQFATEPKPPKQVAMKLARLLINSSSSRIRGIRDVLKMAVAGTPKWLSKWEYSLHVAVEGFDQRTADKAAKLIKGIGKRHGGKLLPPSMAILFHIDPFQPVERLIIGPNNEVSIPSHCNVAPSRAHEFISVIEKYFKDNEALMKKHGITVSLVYLSKMSLLGPEPVLYWHDSMSPLRLSVIQDLSKREMLSKIPPNPEARKAAIALRLGLREVFKAFGGSNLQYGKYYPYSEFLASEETFELMKEIKTSLDPNNIMNPGALGLDA